MTAQAQMVKKLANHGAKESLADYWRHEAKAHSLATHSAPAWLVEYEHHRAQESLARFDALHNVEIAVC